MQLVCRSNTGCELLKCLVMGGFHNIQVVDLDTIDVSNLNRQFLFRKHHVGMSKALVRGALALATKRRRNGDARPAQVAADAVQEFNPEAKVQAHHGNIKDAKFGASFFKTFQLVRQQTRGRARAKADACPLTFTRRSSTHWTTCLLGGT